MVGAIGEQAIALITLVMVLMLGVAFGKLADFAGNLAKGARVAVEGELRSHECQREVAVGDRRTSIPQRVWKIRVDFVLKLDRTAMRESSADSSPDRLTSTHSGMLSR